jgi:hypothetical protein
MNEVALKEPSRQTLAKYGLSVLDWQELAKRQSYVCFVCKKLTTTGRLCIDHEHAKGWKKMPPEQRKLYVRGLLCWVCNHYYVGRGISVQKAQNVALYLTEYESRRASNV